MVRMGPRLNKTPRGQKTEGSLDESSQKLSFAHCVIVGDVSQASALCRPATPCARLGFSWFPADSLIAGSH